MKPAATWPVSTASTSRQAAGDQPVELHQNLDSGVNLSPWQNPAQMPPQPASMKAAAMASAFGFLKR